MSYGNPSANFLRSMAFYLSLWNIFIQSKSLRDKYLIKGFSLFIVIFINIIIFLSDIAIGAQSLNQELFGGLIGLGVYLTLFWVMEIYTNDPKTMLSIINMKIFNYLMINFAFSLITLSSVYFNEQIYNEQRNTWIDIIKNKCGYVYENVLFENEDYLLLATVFSNIFAFIGLKHEFVFTFRSSVNNWTKYNFSLEVKEVDSLFSSMDFTKDTQWNHNTLLISFLRLLVICLISCGLMSPYFLISYDDQFWLVLLVKIFLPFSCVLYFHFFVVKLVLKFLRLVNFSSNDLLSSTLEM